MHDQVYSNCVRGTILDSSDCWTLEQEDKKRLEHNGTAMLLCLCNIKKELCISTNSLLSWLKLKHLGSVLRCNKLCWFRHVKQSELYTGQILDLEVEGKRSCGCSEFVVDLRQWNLQAETCPNHGKWSKQLKTASHTHTPWACNVTVMYSEWVSEICKFPCFHLGWYTFNKHLQHNHLLCLMMAEVSLKLIKHTCSWHDKLILWTLNPQGNIYQTTLCWSYSNKDTEIRENHD